MTALNLQTNEKLPDEKLAKLMGDLRQWPELDRKTLTYHAEQSDTLAAKGYRHAAVHEAGAFLETLVQSMTLAVRGDVPEKFRQAVDSHARLRVCRRYLFAPGYIDAEEYKLIDNVFAILRAKGVSAGIVDEAWCRMARQFVRTTTDYLVACYASWRSVSFTPSVASPPIAKPVETAAA